MNPIQVGIITISDRASKGVYDDLGGPALKEAAVKYGWQVIAEGLVPDEQSAIQDKIWEFEKSGCGLILTSRSLGVSHPVLPCGAIKTPFFE